MTEVLVAPDAAGILHDYLDGVLSVPVAYTVPEEKPAEFVSMAIVGGSGRRDLVLQDITVSIDAWSTSAHAAWTLASLIEGYMYASRFTVDAIYNVGQFGAPSDFPDPLSGKPRFRATYTITLRATAL